jgi:hypothetical protein
MAVLANNPVADFRIPLDGQLKIRAQPPATSAGREPELDNAEACAEMPRIGGQAFHESAAVERD